MRIRKVIQRFTFYFITAAASYGSDAFTYVYLLPYDNIQNDSSLDWISVGLVDMVQQELKNKYPNEKNLPRPPHWSGWILAPEEIEFWLDGKNRIHERLRYIKKNNNEWKKNLLNP